MGSATIASGGSIATMKQAITKGRFMRAQLAIMAIWIVLSGGAAVYRVLSIDPIGVSGHRCVMSYYIGKVQISREDQKKANPDLDAPRVNPFERIEKDGICDEASAQSILDLRLHPAATILGSLAPTVVLLPLVYWLSGFSLRRYAARTALIKSRFKVCEFCAEEIRSEAKVCRFCGRDVAQPAPTKHGTPI